MERSTGTAPVVHDLDSMPLPPMPPKILESYKRMWRDPEFFDHLEVGDEGLWAALHGEEIVATDPSHDKVLRLVEDYGPEDILMLHIPPDDVIELY
jgi:hypothetical protein